MKIRTKRWLKVASRLVVAGLCVLTVPVGAQVSTLNSGVLHRDDLSEDDLKRVRAVTQPTNQFDAAEAFEVRSAGAATSMRRPDGNAFSHSSETLTYEQEQMFKVGNGLFKKLWVSSPSSTLASDGLGPLYNARSCQRCHLKDGRGHPPSGPEDIQTSMFLRVSIPPQTAEHRAALAAGDLLVIPEPNYGTQIQDLAVPGLPGEAKMTIEYTEVVVPLSEGEEARLRKPTYGLDDMGYGPLAADAQLSPRVAPQMIGLGLLEAIHPRDIEMLSDEFDADGDGISGRVHYVKDQDGQEARIGRFGYKATAPTVRSQSAGAFAGDIGISTPENMKHWGDCTEQQTACLALPTGVQSRLGKSEGPAPLLDLVTFYSQNLAVPKRRKVGDPEVLRGKEVFYMTGCVACHTPKYVTRQDSVESIHKFQLIWPYTDLLLHDMGEGLADHRPVGTASGTEWKTPPLWGIGLTETVSGHSYFLHDGRARNLLEAVLWHGGEAQRARDHVVAMPKADRDALLAFLRSL